MSALPPPGIQYLVVFWVLATKSEWNEEVIKGVYLSGHNEQLKDELSLKDELDSNDMLISFTIRHDAYALAVQGESQLAPLLSSHLSDPLLIHQSSPKASVHSLSPF